MHHPNAIPVVLLVFSCLSISWVGSQDTTALPTDAAAARADYLAQRKNGLIQLNQRYIAKLNESLLVHTKAGQLEKALAVKEEVTRIEAEIAELTGIDPRPTGSPAAGPGSAPQPGTPFAVVIEASAEKGVMIDGILQGDKLVLQFQSGKWKSHGKLATEDPDAVLMSNGDENRLGIFGRKAGVSRPVRLAVVPPETAKRPFEFLVPPDYREVFLRINDDPDDGWKENPGKVFYLVTIAKPVR